MNDLKSELRRRLPTDDLLRLVSVLRDFKAHGGSKDAAYEALIELRAEPGLAGYEDRVLELMDFVQGFCSPHMRIWGADE